MAAAVPALMVWCPGCVPDGQVGGAGLLFMPAGGGKLFGLPAGLDWGLKFGKAIL